MDLGQPLLRHADPPVLRHAQGHGGGRGGRRAALRGPAGHGALRARRRAARDGGRGLPAQRHDVQRDRVPAAHPAGRRRGDPAPPLAPDHRRGRRAGRVRGGDDAAAGHAARACSRATTCAARCATRTATRRARGSCPSSRRRTWPAAACGRWSSCAASSRSRSEHGLRLHMDGARLMNAVVASGVPAAEMTRGLRHRVAGLHEGPRRAAGRVPRRLGRADRGGVALQADARRRAAPGGDRRRGRAVRARPQRRPAGRRPRERRARWRAGSPASPGVTLDPDEVETNIVIFEVDDPDGRVRRVGARQACCMGAVGRAPGPRRHAFGCRRRRGTTCAAGGRTVCSHEARRHPPHHGDHRRRAAQRRLLRARARAAAGQEVGQPGRPDRLPPLLRRRERLGGRRT